MFHDKSAKTGVQILFQLLQQSFTNWREATFDGRVIYNKAVALYDWKCQVISVYSLSITVKPGITGSLGG